MSYHNMKITKSNPESSFKIIEETQEYIDAMASGNRIMAMTELSDIYLALTAEAAKHGLKVKDLEIMANATKRAFDSGDRSHHFDQRLYESITDHGTEAYHCRVLKISPTMAMLVATEDAHIADEGDITVEVGCNTVVELWDGEGDVTIMADNVEVAVLREDGDMAMVTPEHPIHISCNKTTVLRFSTFCEELKLTASKD